jgi:hypothetical protein
MGPIGCPETSVRNCFSTCVISRESADQIQFMFGKGWSRKWVPLFFLWWYSGRGMNLTIYLHRVPSMRMSGAIYTYAPPPLHAFMAWKRTFFLKSTAVVRWHKLRQLVAVVQQCCIRNVEAEGTRRTIVMLGIWFGPIF